nr:MAG TPA: hypothetical protein [Caudoviricetes sp.]
MGGVFESPKTLTKKFYCSTSVIKRPSDFLG